MEQTEIRRLEIAECKQCKKLKKIYNLKKFICKGCYNQLHRNPEKKKLVQKKWYDSHPNYFNEYYKKNKVNNAKDKQF